MSDSSLMVRKKINSAGDLQSVVRTMKASAAASIGQYTNSLDSLQQYGRAVDMSLGLCLRRTHTGANSEAQNAAGSSVVGVVFGTDQGLVGAFNDVIANLAISSLEEVKTNLKVYAIGARVGQSLADGGLPLKATFGLPGTIEGITQLVGDIQIKIESERDLVNGQPESVMVFHNRPKAGNLYEPVAQKLLPLDKSRVAELNALAWPPGQIPEIVGNLDQTMGRLIREYLFISLFRACAESQASENASRLAAMQRADKSISDLISSLTVKFHRERQTAIDEELFDVVSGFSMLKN